MVNGIGRNGLGVGIPVWDGGISIHTRIHIYLALYTVRAVKNTKSIIDFNLPTLYRAV